MLRIGIIGFGRLGKIHADNVSNSKLAAVVAVCDTDDIKLEQARKLYNCAVFNNLEDLFAFELHAVIIASSTPMHLEHIEEATKHKVAIFTEKPVGLSLEETDRVLALINESNIAFQIGFQRRWDHRFIKAKKVLNSGQIGKALMYKAYGRDPNASNPSNWGLDKNGGLFLNAAIHDYDAARFVLGQEIIQVSAIGAVVHHKGLEEHHDFDTALTTMLTTGGAIVNTEWSRYATYGYDMGLEIIGTEGAIKISQNIGDEFLVINRNDAAPSVIEVFSDSYQKQIDAFIQSLVDKSLPSPSVEDARIALNLALTARDSASNMGIPLKPKALSKL